MKPSLIAPPALLGDPLLLAVPDAPRRVIASCTLQMAQDATANQPLSRSPQFILRARGSARPLHFLTVASDVSFENSRLTVYGDASPTFVLWNANVTVHPGDDAKAHFPSVLHHVSINIRINNLLNFEYGPPVGYELLNPSIRQNGRNFVLKMMWTL